MHGIICKAVEAFLIDRYGAGCWRDIVAEADIGLDRFETVRRYDPAALEAVIMTAARIVGVAPSTLLEDIGTWVCTHPPLEPIRRLFRFSGATYEEMLFSLEEVHERARMALPDLDLPVLSLAELGDGRFRVASTFAQPGASKIILGVLRAMADDYGVFVVVEPWREAEVNGAWIETISVQLLDDAFASPREFRLRPDAGAAA